MNNIIKNQKKASFWMKIIATTIIIAGAIIGITLGGIHIYQNAKWGSPFSETYQANVKFSKKEGNANIDDALNNLQSKINPINQKQISINKISSNELNITASANMYHHLRDFLRDIERPGSIFFLDQEGNDLLIGTGEKSSYTPSIEKSAKRLPLNKLIDQAKTAAGMSNNFTPTVKLKVIEAETFAAISKYLESKKQTLWIWTDIGAMFDEMRNNYDDFLAFKSSITTKIRQLLNEGKEKESKALNSAISDLLRVNATHKNPAISKNVIFNIDLFAENDITKINNYFNNYNLDFIIKNHDSASNGRDLTVDINNPEYNYDKNQVLNPFRPFLQDIVKEVGIVKYSKYVINGNLKNDEITNTGITPDSKDSTLFHIPVNGFEKSHILEKVLKVGIEGIIFSIDTYGIKSGIISEKTFNIAILIAAIFSALLIIFLIAYYRLAGLIISLMIATSVIVSIVIFNFLSGLYGAEVIIAILVGLAIGIISNIILMERLKEEFSLNKQMWRAFKDSNRKSLSTVFDINIISLLASLILFWFGINMIKSFAIMLIMIILSTIVISILLTRITFVLLIKTNIFEQKTFLFGDNKTIFKKEVKLIKSSKVSLNKFNFIKSSKWFGIIAAIFISVGGIVSLTAGPKNSLDFHSGTIYKIDYNSSIGQPNDEKTYNELSTVISDYIKENISNIPYEISKIIDNSNARYFLQLKIGKANSQQRDALRDYINNIIEIGPEVVSTNDFEPKSMYKLIINALIAVAIMLGILMIYIFIRFNWSFSLSMIIGIIIDIMMLAAFVVIVRLELTLPLLIVFLGLLIFGIIQKTLLFDRTREILIEYKDQNLDFKALAKITNQAIILTFKQSLLFLIIMPILVLGLIGFGSINLIILFILGMFITYLTTIFAISWLFVLFGNILHKSKQKRLHKIHQPIDKDEIDEQLVSGINS